MLKDIFLKLMALLCQYIVNPTKVTAGHHHTCALTDEGVRCWGLNDQGQTDVPIDLLNPTEIFAKGSHTCALTDWGLRCWGGNDYGGFEVPPDLVF